MYLCRQASICSCVQFTTTMSTPVPDSQSRDSRHRIQKMHLKATLSLPETSDVPHDHQLNATNCSLGQAALGTAYAPWLEERVNTLNQQVRRYPVMARGELTTRSE